MMANWRTVPMGELCSIQSGKSDTKGAVVDGPYAFFDRSKSIKRSSRFLRDCEALIIPGEGAEFLPRHFVRKFDLHQRAYAPFNFSSHIDATFLYHYLCHVADYFPGVAVGATVKSLRLRHFEQLPVRLTDPVTQRRIIAILDDTFEGITAAKTNAEKSLQNARELYECQLESLFAAGGAKWPERSLEQVASIINGFAFKSTDFQSTPRVKSIKITNVGVREFVADAGNHLPTPFAQRHAGVAVAMGSIVLALTRTIITGGLKVAVVPADFHGALLNQRVAAIQPRASELGTAFLYAYLSTRRVMDHVKSRVNTLMQPNLSIGDLRQLPLPVPAMSEQRALVALLTRFGDESKRLESAYRRKLAALDELKNSLLHQAFSGGLSP